MKTIKQMRADATTRQLEKFLEIIEQNDKPISYIRDGLNTIITERKAQKEEN